MAFTFASADSFMVGEGFICSSLEMPLRNVTYNLKVWRSGVNTTGKKEKNVKYIFLFLEWKYLKNGILNMLRKDLSKQKGRKVVFNPLQPIAELFIFTWKVKFVDW